jgi:protein-S-isoprenylcysteine O-methyltransferase Ste14
MIPGVSLYALSVILGGWAMIVNQYFEATVRIQDERGQSVIKDGPYRLIPIIW